MARYIDADALIRLIEIDAICYKPYSRRDAIACIKAINTADVVPKSEVEKLVQDGTRLGQENETLKDNNEHLAVILEETRIELEAMRGAANSLKMHYEKAEAEVRRLRGILLQFTDIVHKWGAKNNIDTSEISLVPILQQEADSIIKKANQELARELFAEIEKVTYKDFMEKSQDFEFGYKIAIQEIITELKKKYTEETQ